MSAHTTFERVTDTGVIAIARDVDAEVILDTVEALVEGGITTVEITVDSAGAIEMIHRVSRELGDNVSLGAGTVLDSETARAVQLAGAEFVVTPTVNTDVIQTCNRYGITVIPGVMTPTEALTATEAGADLCKLFPASTVGPSQVKAINGPLGQVPLVPTGGISLDNVADFFESGAVAVGVGSSLVDDEAIAAGDFDRVSDTAAQFVELAQKHR